MVKIARSTADGRWTLTQTFTQSAGDASVKVAMAIKNNTAVSRTIWLTRFTDIDANNSTSNILDGTVESVWGYSASETAAGLAISLAAPNPFNNFGLAENQVENACSIGRNFRRVAQRSGWVRLLVSLHHRPRSRKQDSNPQVQGHLATSILG